EAVKSMWFDGQAEQFDESAGLDPAVGQGIAVAIRELSNGTAEAVLLDLGAGTGAIGLHFANLPGRYVGLDLSPTMLEIFQRKLAPWPGHMLLVQADSDRPWPIRDRALAGVFASRVVHHLQPEHFVQELLRVCRVGGTLLLGRVLREPDSFPSRLLRYKQSLLAQYGIRTRAGGLAIQEIADRCCQRGGRALPATAVAQWTRTTTARRLLASWEKKPGLSS